MICKPCREAADVGKEGIAAHFYAGCSAITLASILEGTGSRFKVDATRCDCQHRDDLPKRELKASEV